MPGPTPELLNQYPHGRHEASVFLTRLLHEVPVPSALVRYPYFTDEESKAQRRYMTC